MKTILIALTTLLSLNSFALEVGETAPCVVLNHLTTDGGESEHCIREPNVEGQFKVLEFFSTTCSACQRNLPKFSALHDELGEMATFRLVGIDRSENRVRNYVQSRRSLINFETAIDNERDAKRAYDVIQTPTLFVLDQNDVVVFKHEGVLKEADKNAIRALIK